MDIEKSPWFAPRGFKTGKDQSLAAGAVGGAEGG